MSFDEEPGSQSTELTGEKLKPMMHQRVRSKRIAQACDFCHRWSLKCRVAPLGANDEPQSSCLSCLEYSQECTRHRQPQERGGKPRTPGKHTADCQNRSVKKNQSLRWLATCCSPLGLPLQSVAERSLLPSSTCTSTPSVQRE